MLNTGRQDAHLDLTLYFEDREPIRSFKAVCKAERTNHIRLDLLRDEKGQAVPQDVPYAIMVESDQPVVVQYLSLIHIYVRTEEDLAQMNFEKLEQLSLI